MPRALLTEGERDAITNPESVPKGSRYTLLSRVESKIEAMAEDAQLLREHNPELADKLHQAVCEREFDERADDLEAELEELKQRIDNIEGDSNGT